MSLLTAESLEGFVGSVLLKRFDNPAPIPECHREWWRLCTSSHPFVAIAAPRGHAKSTAITHSYLLACVLFRERQFVLLISGTEAQSILFLNDIKNELKDNELIQKLFGRIKFLKDAETDIICEMSGGHKFRIMAKGSEQSLRGAKWSSKRPDLIICDDMEEDEQVMSKDRRDKFKRWFMGALIPLRSDRGIIRIVGTILHMDSLLENLMPENQLKSSRKGKFLIEEPLKTYTEHRLPWLSVKYRAHDDTYEHILWPDKRTKEWLIAERDKFIQMGLPEVYAQEYLNVPIDESVAFFKRSDFKLRTEEDRKKKLRYYIAGDLAISEKARADYSVFVVGGLDEHGLLHIVNVVRDRLNGLEIADTIFALEKMYKPEIFAMEEGQISKAIGPFLNEQMLRRGIFPNITGLRPSADKPTRARSIQARIRAGGIRFEKDSDWYQAFEDECTRFPRDKHDDQVDAFAYLGLVLDQMAEAPTQEEMRNEEIMEDMHFSGLLEEGRCVQTGY